MREKVKKDESTPEIVLNLRFLPLLV